MKTKDLSDQQLADYSREHLLYELQVFQWTAGVLPYMQGVLHYALLESFVIHLRNLIDFFYTKRQKEDDVVATDFFDDPSTWTETMSDKLKIARERAHKEVSHLTLNRKGDERPDKPWQVGELFEEVQAIAKKFAAKASRPKLHADVRNFLNVPESKVMFSATTSASTMTITHFLWFGEK